jgi:hypothetical protein
VLKLQIEEKMTKLINTSLNSSFSFPLLKSRDKSAYVLSHVCNLSYTGDDQEDHGYRRPREKVSKTPYQQVI